MRRLVDLLRGDGWDLTPLAGGLILIAVLALVCVVWGLANG